MNELSQSDRDCRQLFAADEQKRVGGLDICLSTPVFLSWFGLLVESVSCFCDRDALDTVQHFLFFLREFTKFCFCHSFHFCHIHFPPYRVMKNIRRGFC